jgi:glycosyltransferase involved in cell wall biosynthesis
LQIKVSIIIAAYNAEKFIAATLESVLDQSWNNLEVIVVNDGSTDTTLSIIEKYLKRGIQVITQDNKGQDASFNNGYKQSTGDYIKFMDADDLINAEMIEVQMTSLAGSAEYIAYGEWGRFYNDIPASAIFAGLPYWKDMQPIDFLIAGPAGVMLQCGIMLVPKTLIEKAGLWDERLIIFNDTEFFTRVVLASKGIQFTAGAKLYYRSGQAGSVSSQRSRESFQSSYLAFCLIGKQMMAYEPSKRVKSLVANMFEHRYHEMYPAFPELGEQYKSMISFYGGATSLPKSSFLYNLSSKLIGWKKTKSIRLFLANKKKPK